MAKQTINGPRINSPVNTGDGTENGDQPATIVAKINAMMADLYGATQAAAKYTANATVGATTAAAGDLTGALTVTANYSAVGANNLTTRTAAQMFADAGAVVGQAYELAIMNTSGFTMTLVGGANVTVNGTATIAQSTVRWFVVTFNSATTLTIQNSGSGNV
jgi:hypothetical protein